MQPDNDERVYSLGAVWNCPDDFPVLSGFGQVAACLAGLAKREFINRASAPPTRLKSRPIRALFFDFWALSECADLLSHVLEKYAVFLHIFDAQSDQLG